MQHPLRASKAAQPCVLRLSLCGWHVASRAPLYACAARSSSATLSTCRVPGNMSTAAALRTV